MLISEAINAAQRLAGNVVEQSDMLRWLSELDGQIAFESYRAETWMPYTADDLTSALLVPYPYDKVYIPHLEAMIYYSRGEYDRYENSRTVRDTFLDEFRRFVQRTRDCLGRITVAQAAGGSGVTTVSGRDDVWRMVSAYGIAVLHGYAGTEEEWLDEITHYNREQAGDAAVSAQEAAQSALSASASATSATAAESAARSYSGAAAESASAAAESAGSAAVSSQTASAAADSANAAQTAAESAQTAAESAQTAAETAQSAAEAAQTAAESAQSDAEDSAEDAEAWAVGQIGGVDVPSTDSRHENNAKYYKEQAAAANQAAQAVLDAVVDAAGIEEITTWSETHYYIKNNGDTVDLDNPTYVRTVDVRYLVTQCAPGDTFKITATGGSSYRPYSFQDASSNVLVVAPSGTIMDDTIVTAPMGSATLLVNDNTMAGSVYKGNFHDPNMISMKNKDYIGIASGTDLNNVTQPGNYLAANSGITNSLLHCPVTNTGFILKNIETTMAGASTRFFQLIITNHTNPDLWIRGNSGSWGEWQTLTKKDSTITMTNLILTADNYLTHFPNGSFNDAPLNSIVGIGNNVPLTDGPEGDNWIGYSTHTSTGYIRGTLLTFRAHETSATVYSGVAQMLIGYRDTAYSPTLSYRTAIAGDNGLAWSAWSKFAQNGYLRAGNRVISAGRMSESVSDLDNMPLNVMWQIDKNCTGETPESTLGHHPFPGVSCVAVNMAFSSSTRHGQVQTVYALDGRVAWRYGYQNDVNDYRWKPFTYYATYIPTAPTTDGTYTLRCTVSNGTASYAWVSVTSLISIAVTTPPTKTVYSALESFDATGMVVTATYSNGATLIVSGYTVAPDPLTVGTTEVTITYTEDGVSKTATQAVTVSKAQVPVPTVSGTLTYDGTEQSPTISNEPSLTVATRGGDASAINAGSYTKTYTLIDTANCEWATSFDGNLAWGIDKAAAVMSVSPASVALNSSAPTAVASVLTNSPGALSTSTSDSSVATASVSGTTVTVSSVGSHSGTATITISQAATENFLAASATISATASFFSVYGISWDGSASLSCTRTDAAALFSDPVPYVAGASSYSSPFDDLAPWKDMVRVTDSEAGEMVKIPKFWYKLTAVGTKGVQVQIADGAAEGFSVCPACMDRGDGAGERDYVLVGRYHCGAGDYKSKTGVVPLTRVTQSTFRQNCHSLGAKVWMMDFATRFTIWLLYIVEFANWDSQAKIGYGCGNGSSAQSMGYTDAMPYHTGTTQSARTTYGLGTQYRYIEGLWDNVFDRLTGCYNGSDGLHITLNPSAFSEDSGGTAVGTPAHGWTSGWSIVSAAGFPMFISSEAVGDGSNYISDQWNFSAGSPVIGAGGEYGTQRQAYGMFCTAYTGLVADAGTVGSRLLKLP